MFQGAQVCAHLEITLFLFLNHVPGDVDSKILCLNGLKWLSGPVWAFLLFLLKAESTNVYSQA